MAGTNKHFHHLPPWVSDAVKSMMAERQSVETEKLKLKAQAASAQAEAAMRPGDV